MARAVPSLPSLGSSALDLFGLRCLSRWLTLEAKLCLKTRTYKVSSSLFELIRKNLPMPIDQFMAMALNHPKYGYYANHAAIGAEGDFITAPEISQLFGEIVGAWVVQHLQLLADKLPEPQQIALIELGPGRGILLEDVLHVVTKLRPNLLERVKLQLVEVNPSFKLLQQQVGQRYGLQAKWYNQVGALPEGPAIVLANEFFDALPIKQYIWRSGVWHERVIAAGENGEFGFSAVPVSPHIAATLASKYPHPCEQGIVELSMAREETFKLITSQIASHGGAMWVCDYGYANPSFQSTLRAFYRHTVINIFEKLGEADMTSDVNFGNFIEIASKYSNLQYHFSTQGEWLVAHGVYYRLGNTATNNQSLVEAYNKLVSAEDMGEKFKVLTIVNNLD